MKISVSDAEYNALRNRLNSEILSQVQTIARESNDIISSFGFFGKNHRSNNTVFAIGDLHTCIQISEVSIPHSFIKDDERLIDPSKATLTIAAHRKDPDSIYPDSNWIPDLSFGNYGLIIFSFNVDQEDPLVGRAVWEHIHKYLTQALQLADLSPGSPNIQFSRNRAASAERYKAQSSTFHI